MAYEYTALSVEDRQALAEQRIRQYEAELFGHEMNLAALASLPDDDPGKEQATRQANDAIATLAAAIAAAKERL